MGNEITVHGVLAGAYKSAIKTTLTHASADGGNTAICKRVKLYSLCDMIEPGPPTCPTCAAKLAKLAKPATRKSKRVFAGVKDGKEVYVLPATKSTTARLEAAANKLVAHRNAIAEIRGELSDLGILDESLAKVIRALYEVDIEIEYALEDK